jgi:predicted nucleic acid-binding protein
MSDRYFLDTNILVYSLDTDEPRKALIAEKLVTDGATTGLGAISHQVVQEFFNVALRRFKVNMTAPELERYFFRVLLPLMKISPSASLFLDALQFQSRNQLAWYDSLIVAAAIQGRCKTLYTEDLQHGQRFGDLVVQNPFL